MAADADTGEPYDTTPVRLARDDRSTERYEVFEERDDGRHVYAWGFQSADAARTWVEQHNELSPYVRLHLEN
jgi:hypothetical protein